LIIPNDAIIIQSYLDEFNKEKHIPPPLKQLESNLEYFDGRYSASSKWIAKNNHAVISNGPFYLNAYSPESRTISVSAFDDASYPFKAGHWSAFENTEFPKITEIQVPNLIQKQEELNISVKTAQADAILYFLNNNQGDLVLSETIKIEENPTMIKISGDRTKELGVGANDLKIFAISDSVLKPDFYSTSFLVTDSQDQIPKITTENTQSVESEGVTGWFTIPIIGIIIISLIYLKKRK
jgi:peptide/nickel transport system substrate-binding protein